MVPLHCHHRRCRWLCQCPSNHHQPHRRGNYLRPNHDPTRLQLRRLSAQANPRNWWMDPIAMKRFLLILALLLTPSAAWAQCNGVFPALSACGNPTGSAAIPTIMPLSSITAAAGTNGQVQYNNSGVLGGYTSVQLGAVVPGIGGTTDASLPPYNADPTGVSSSTTAINSAIAAACPSANGTVYLPPGTYLINGGLNMTNITGGHISGGCRLRGAVNTATVLKTTTSTNAAIDLTGSSSIIIEDLWIQTAATTTFGILLSASNTLPCNVIRMMNVTIAGLF